jgi:hypothetical protein
VEPLHALLEKYVKFGGKINNTTFLQYPDFAEDFILNTDASNQGLGEVLSQGKR